MGEEYGVRWFEAESGALAYAVVNMKAHKSEAQTHTALPRDISRRITVFSLGHQLQVKASAGLSRGVRGQFSDGWRRAYTALHGVGVVSEKFFTPSRASQGASEGLKGRISSHIALSPMSLGHFPALMTTPDGGKAGKTVRIKSPGRQNRTICITLHATVSRVVTKPPP